VLERTGLLPLSEAIAQMHFPADMRMLQRARARLGFDEFLLIQLGVVQRRLRWQGEMGYPLTIDRQVHEELLGKLPFALTGAQARSLEEIFADVQRPVPMARMLQGDVGSGKTVVAAAALLQAIANGLQGALMAPTEILAEQHYKGLRQLLGGVHVPRTRQQEASASDAGGDWKERLEDERRERMDEIKRLLGMTPEDDLGGEGVRVALLTGSLGAKQRRRVLEGIAKGEVDLVVGTHALITEGVQYHSLGLVCIDEQHRFGVEQRERLKQKGFNPHMLVMTATPIPRTLTLTIYGELDTSLLDELPPGRQQIRTLWITQGERYKAYKHIRKEVEQGRQVFVICPLVEESEKIDLPSAEEMHERLSHEFSDLRVGLIHGRLLSREKDQVMRAFRDHEFDILVATAVVEVGIDIPNASTIVIEGAERFGLAQLHQFRGRVGRGVHQSYCVLVSDVANETTQKRLGAMEETHDGFQLAEIDLELRGPGEFFGKRQSGTPDLKVARLADVPLLVSARREAQALLDDDPDLTRPEHTLLRRKMEAFWANVEGAS
jgi:ATP-dependent DNA helicase RecG